MVFHAHHNCGPQSSQTLTTLPRNMLMDNIHTVNYHLAPCHGSTLSKTRRRIETAPLSVYTRPSTHPSRYPHLSEFVRHGCPAHHETCQRNSYQSSLLYDQIYPLPLPLLALPVSLFQHSLTFPSGPSDTFRATHCTSSFFRFHYQFTIPKASPSVYHHFSLEPSS